MEKIPKPKAEAANATDFVPTALEENVIAELHETTQKHRGQPRDETLLNKFHADVEQCECFPLFQKYEAGEIPNLERMFANLKPLLSELQKDIEGIGDPDHPDAKHLQQTLKLLEGREKQTRDAIQRYVNSVIRFRQLAKISLGGVRDVSKQFEDADHARRRAHNSLIETLSVYVRQAQALIDLGYGDSEHYPFVSWSMGMDAREVPQGKTPIMSETVLRNRDFVRDWAIVADFKDQLDILGAESA